MFKAIYRGENGLLGMQNGNEYFFNCKPSLVGRGFSVATKQGIKLEYSNMTDFISDWSEIKIA